MNIGGKRILIGIGLLISLVMLFFTFRDLHPEQFWDSLRQVDLPLLPLAALIYFLAVAVIALR